MNVKQLIEELKLMPQDAMCVVRGYEGGVNEVTLISETTLEPYPSKAWYYGDWDTDAEEGIPGVSIG